MDLRRGVAAAAEARDQARGGAAMHDALGHRLVDLRDRLLDQRDRLARLRVERGARLLERRPHRAERDAVAQLALGSLPIALLCRFMTRHELAPRRGEVFTSR